MYVCVCHALRCRDVEEAAGQGVRKHQELHRHFGLRPQCGRCLPTIRDMLGKSGEQGCGCKASSGGR